MWRRAGNSCAVGRPLRELLSGLSERLNGLLEPAARASPGLFTGDLQRLGEVAYSIREDAESNATPRKSQPSGGGPWVPMPSEGRRDGRLQAAGRSPILRRPEGR